jgi:hypothetical protein
MEGSCERGNEHSGSIKRCKFLSGCTVGSFSRRAQLHEWVRNQGTMTESSTSDRDSCEGRSRECVQYILEDFVSTWANE